MTIKTHRVQIGQSGTATQNFTINADAQDGTMKLQRGVAGAATQDILTVDANGYLIATQVPPQFDTTSKLATMGSLKQAAGSFAGHTNILSSRSLTVADIGQTLWTSALGLVLTLPTPASLGISAGASVTVYSSANTSVTATPGAGCTLQNSAGIGLDVFIRGGACATFHAVSANTWHTIHSTADLGSIYDFGASLAGNGYQRLPSGLIIQWVTSSDISIPAGSETLVNATLPIAFPNQVLFVTPSSFVPSLNTSGVFVSLKAYTTTLATAAVVSTVAQNVRVQFLAIGR